MKKNIRTAPVQHDGGILWLSFVLFWVLNPINVQEELPEPRSYERYADGADVLREMESLYAATGSMVGAPVSTQSAPVIPSSIETTIPPRAASSRF